MASEESPLLNSLLPHILPALKSHLSSEAESRKPYLIALSGPQGSGKTTVTSLLSTALSSILNINVIALSLDDFYLTHAELQNLGQTNDLWKQRGLPGTHDVVLASKFFSQFLNIKESPGDEALKIPKYDKSANLGAGDRAPEATWLKVHPSQVDVVILEGWCVGFTSLGAEVVRQRWEHAQTQQSETHFISKYTLSDVQAMDDALSSYCNSFENPKNFNVLIVLDIESSNSSNSMEMFLETVYKWRLQQEHALLKSHSSGMTDSQVRKFVEGYMPGYELYLPGLRSSSFFGDEKGKKQIRVLLDDKRDVVDVVGH